MMGSQQEQPDDDEYDDEFQIDTQYTRDDKMKRVKVKRKRGANQKRVKHDYESPYAEYLLGAIKDPEAQKKAEVLVR